jgi:hypothetical protein
MESPFASLPQGAGALALPWMPSSSCLAGRAAVPRPNHRGAGAIRREGDTARRQGRRQATKEARPGRACRVGKRMEGDGARQRARGSIRQGRRDMKGKGI